MSSNTKQFTLIGIAAGLFASILIAGLAGNVARGNYLAVPAIGGALVFAAGAVWLGVWLNQRRIQLMFRRPTPDRLLEHYHAALIQARARKIPHADAATAQLCALAATVYGQYDLARQELAAADWDSAPTMYQGHRRDLLALIALLGKADVATARELAMTVPPEKPPILHNAVLVAIGEADAGAILRVERAAARNMGAIPAVCAWALSLYAERSGQADAAERYRVRAREAAPHFSAVI